MDRKNISRGVRLLAACALCVQGILLCKKLRNKRSGSMIFRPIRLIRSIVSYEELPPALYHSNGNIK